MTVMESKTNIRTRGAPSGLVTSEITKAPGALCQVLGTEPVYILY